MQMTQIKKSSLGRLLFGNVKQTFSWKNGKPTDELAAITINATCAEGDVKIILPPQAKLFYTIEQKFQFGKLFNLEDIFEVEDVIISIYKDSLSIKILADIKEELL